MRTITIAPIKREKGTTVILHGKYFSRKLNSVVNILTNGNVVTRECNPGEKTKNITISDQNPEFIFTWDENAKGADATGILEAKAWSRNTTVDCPGNSNLIRAMFKMVDLTEKVTIDVKLLKLKGRVYNIINNFTVKEMRDIAFFVGENPIKESPDEIFIKLVDFENGKLMKDPNKFINNITTPDMDYIVIAKKAILYGIIQEKDNQYYINTELIGSSFTDVLAYCKSNKQQFEIYIQTGVEKVDVLPVDIDWDKPVKDIIGMLKKAEQPETPIKEGIAEVKEASEKKADKEKKAELDQLKGIAKELKIPKYWVMGKDKLLKEIENAKTKEEFPKPEEEVMA